MSKSALAAEITRALSHQLDYLANTEKNRKAGISQRYNVMEKQTGFLDLNPEGIRKGSRQRIIRRNGSTANIDRISQKQAELITKAAIKYYESNTQKMDYAALGSVMAKAELTPMTMTGDGTYSAMYDDKTGKMTTKISKTLLIVHRSEIGGALLAPSFGSLRVKSSNFAKAFQDFLNRRGRTFYGLTKSDLAKAGKATSNDIGELFGKSKIHVGHLGSNVDTTRKSVSEASVAVALEGLAGFENIQAYFTEGNLEKFIARAKKVNVKNFAQTHKPFWARFVKNTRDLEHLKLIFELETYGWHTGSLNSGVLQTEEYGHVERMLEERFIETLIRQVDFPNQEGSPSFISGALNTLKHIFFKDIKKAENKSFKVKAPKIKRGQNTTTIIKGKLKTPDSVLKKVLSGTIPTKPVKSFAPAFILEIPEEILEEKESCMLSVEQLLALTGRLNSSIEGMIKSHMKRPALVYRTGRFAGSVKIDSVLQTPDCTIVPKYSYMTRPYAVFDPSISNYRNLSSPTRNPRKIIGDSIRALAAQVIREKYTVTPQWSGG